MWVMKTRAESSECENSPQFAAQVSFQHCADFFMICLSPTPDGSMEVFSHRAVIVFWWPQNGTQSECKLLQKISLTHRYLNGYLISQWPTSPRIWNTRLLQDGWQSRIKATATSPCWLLNLVDWCLSYFEHAVRSLENMSFLHPFLEPHQSIYHSNISYSIKISNRLTHIFLKYLQIVHADNFFFHIHIEGRQPSWSHVCVAYKEIKSDEASYKFIQIMLQEFGRFVK